MSYQPKFNPSRITDPEWAALNWELKKQAREMEPTEVEKAFEEAVQHLLDSHRRDLREFLRTVADGLKKFTRQEYVYRTRLRQMYAENRELQKRVTRLERYEASIQGFNDMEYISLDSLEDKECACVYVIRDVEVTGFCKIGYATNLYRRFTQLTKMPFRMEIVAVLYSDNIYALEANLHATYASKRVRGEWFALSAQQLAEIKRKESDKE